MSVRAKLSKLPPVKEPVHVAKPKSEPKNSFAAASVVGVLKGMIDKAGKTKEGDDSVVSTMADGIESDVTSWIPTGFPHMDAAFGGGWPLGRVSELYGPESSGKSALTHCAVYACQKRGGMPIVVDWEGALDSVRMKNNGIDGNNLVYLRPGNIERAWELVWAALDHINAMDKDARPTSVLVVWDSIAASIPKAETESNDTDTNSNFALSKQMARGCRKAFLKAARCDAHFLFVNQERDQIGGGFKSWGGPPKVTPGGKAVKYAASLRIRCVKIETIKVGSRATGYKIKTTTQKNKCAAPHQSVEWIIDFDHGCGFEVTAWSALMEARVIKAASNRKVVDPVTNKSRLVKVHLTPWQEEPMTREEFIAAYRKTPALRKAVLASFTAKCMQIGEEDPDAEASTSTGEE